MRPLGRILLYGSLAIVLLHVAGSLVLRIFAVPNGSGGSGFSSLIYAFTGFFAASVRGWKGAALAGLVLALVDVTIGWGIAWMIAPGRRPAGMSITPGAWLTIASMMALSAVTYALIGAAIARFSRGGPQWA
ncbi:MAG TPA: hypothetical protein VF178_04520 [Gemmatimonadaceae bacterium]